MNAAGPLPLHVTDPLDSKPIPLGKAANAAQAAKVGRDFEEMFLSQMLAPMFDGLHTDGAFGGGFGEKMFRSLQVTEFARAIVQSGGIGIANAVARELITLQEKANG